MPLLLMLSQAGAGARLSARLAWADHKVAVAPQPGPPVYWCAPCISVSLAVLQDPSVMAASLCALGELVARDARPYRNLIPSFVSILKQITDGKLPKAFDYHKVPAPFIQVPAVTGDAQSPH